MVVCSSFIVTDNKNYLLVFIHLHPVCPTIPKAYLEVGTSTLFTAANQTFTRCKLLLKSSLGLNFV